MQAFSEFLVEVAQRGEVANLIFEEHLFRLVGIVERISAVLNNAQIAHELVGGLAVLVYVEEANPELTPLTRDVDIMIGRSDLDRVKSAAEANGFTYRHTAGLDMLLYGDSKKAINAVHLVFAGERVRPAQLEPNPALSPRQLTIKGTPVFIIPIGDLVRMKLSSFRDKDRVQIRTMDAAGLITEQVERELTSESQQRLKQVRETE